MNTVFDQIANGTATMQSMYGIADWRAGFVIYQNLQRRATGESLDDGEFGLWMAYEPDAAQLLLIEIDEIAQQVRIALEDAAADTQPTRSNTMQITEDALINTAAVASAMNIDKPLLTDWGWGCVELYHAITEWAGIVTEEEAHLSAVLTELDEGWPGVFAYAVSEEVGVAVRKLIQSYAEVSHERVRSDTRLQIRQFCAEHPAVFDAYLLLSLAANPAPTE